MLNHLRPAALLLLICTALTGIAYPLALTGVASVIAPVKAGGSIVLRDGAPVGSTLIGQNFATDRYFWPRPSAAGDKGYDGLASSGSNLGPTSQKLADRMAQDAARFTSTDRSAAIPADAITASGSGLDPHISLANALAQAARVAAARNVGTDEVLRVVETHTEKPVLGLFGPPRVNVLEANLALDRLEAHIVTP